MANATTPSQAQPALLFIPDISGFTQFVNDTEINHARHIIEELLNLIIDSNQLGLEVSEIEGDAILFCRTGPPPTASELSEQVKKMFTQFHFHLQKYDTHRICNCSACKSANSLTLKFIAHYGEVTFNQVQQHKKLFGIDVITAHRLLKNDIDKREYALFTDRLISATKDWEKSINSDWSDQKTLSQVYDSGRVDYTYVTLENLYQDIPQLQPDDFRLKGHTASVMKTEAIIEAPLELVFNVASDVMWKPKWIPESNPVTTDVNTQIPQAGQTHKCIAKGPVLVAHDFQIEKDVIHYTETDVSKSYCCVYTLTRMEDGKSHLKNEFFMPKNFFKEFMFKALLKKKYTGMCELSWSNLNTYCKELVANHATHPSQVVLGESPVKKLVA
jgi:hypothetical protein